MYVCMYVCMYIYIYIYISTNNKQSTNKVNKRDPFGLPYELGRARTRSGRSLWFSWGQRSPCSRGGSRLSTTTCKIHTATKTIYIYDI